MLSFQVRKAAEMGCSVGIIIGGVTHTKTAPTPVECYGQQASSGVYKLFPGNNSQDPRRLLVVTDGVGPWKDAMNCGPGQGHSSKVAAVVVRFLEVMAAACVVSVPAGALAVSWCQPCFSRWFVSAKNAL